MLLIVSVFFFKGCVTQCVHDQNTNNEIKSLKEMKSLRFYWPYSWTHSSSKGLFVLSYFKNVSSTIRKTWKYVGKQMTVQSRFPKTGLYRKLQFNLTLCICQLIKIKRTNLN